MSKLNNEVVTFLSKNDVWVLSTCDVTPNACPMYFKKIDKQGNLVLFDVFMKKGLENLAKNNKVAVTVFNVWTLQGYQLKGTAAYSTDPVLVAEGNKQTRKMNLPTKGAVIVSVEEVFVQTPGPDVGKKL